jgi:anhydro-N-acetylmuramic acid kinase
MVLNRLAEREGKPFDDGGRMAAQGSIIPDLLAELESSSYYRELGPRSLGREWVEEHIFPLLDEYRSAGTDHLLNTFCEHVAMRISSVLPAGSLRLLVSGGGAYNTFLINRISQLSTSDIIVPDPLIIEYKEALVFAFLGLLRLKGINNVFASVTGASNDHCAGTIHPTG